MENRLLVSIITVSFNSEDTIKNTIESVLNQTYPTIEYRVVDGGSTDRTVKIAHSFDEEFARRGIPYVITSEPDDGIYDAMNKGIKDSRGELIGIINSDDRYEPDAVETAVLEYKREAYDYFFADLSIVKKDGTTVLKKAKLDKMATSHHWNHPTSFVTKETYDDLGLYKNIGIHDDFDFYLRVRKADKGIRVVNKVIATFSFGGASNRKSWKNSRQRIHDRYSCYRNNGLSRLYIFECVGIEFVKYIVG